MEERACGGVRNQDRCHALASMWRMRKALAVLLCCACATSLLAGAPQRAYADGWDVTFSVGGSSASGTVDINDLLAYGLSVYVYFPGETRKPYGPDLSLYDENGMLIAQIPFGPDNVNGDGYEINTYPIGPHLTPGRSYTLVFRGHEPQIGVEGILFERSTSISVGGTLAVEEPDEGNEYGGGSPDPTGPEGSGLGGSGLEEGNGGIPEVDGGTNDSELLGGEEEVALPYGAGKPFEAAPEAPTTSIVEADRDVQPNNNATHQNINAEEVLSPEADATWEAESNPSGLDSLTQLAFTGEVRSGMTGGELLSRGAVYGLAGKTGLSDTNDKSTMDALDLTITGIPYTMLAMLLILGCALPAGMSRQAQAFRNGLAGNSRLA